MRGGAGAVERETSAVELTLTASTGALGFGAVELMGVLFGGIWSEASGGEMLGLARHWRERSKEGFGKARDLPGLLGREKRWGFLGVARRKNLARD